MGDVPLSERGRIGWRIVDEDVIVRGCSAVEI